MWSGADGTWRDVLWRTGEARTGLSAASYTPLWAGACDAAEADAAVASLKRSGLVQAGGVATTLSPSGQQWDWPNAWPPLQQMIIEGLRTCGGAGGAHLAVEIASRWLSSNHRGWVRDDLRSRAYSPYELAPPALTSSYSCRMHTGARRRHA